MFISIYHFTSTTTLPCGCLSHLFLSRVRTQPNLLDEVVEASRLVGPLDAAQGFRQHLLHAHPACLPACAKNRKPLAPATRPKLVNEYCCDCSLAVLAAPLESVLLLESCLFQPSHSGKKRSMEKKSSAEDGCE